MVAIPAYAAGVLALALSAAAPAADNRVPITDPDVLASMGFARDASDVYRLVPDGAPATDDFGSIDHFEVVHGKDFVASKNPNGVVAAYDAASAATPASRAWAEGAARCSTTRRWSCRGEPC